MSFKVGPSTLRWSKDLKHPLTQKPQVHYWEVTDSTNNQAKQQQSPSGSGAELFVADHQTSGRGRGTHTWTSPQAGSGLLCSWVFKLQKPPQPIITPLVGLALYRALQASWPWLEFSLKAPNDVFLKDRKLAGLLIENLQQGAQNTLIIGLGLNLLSGPDLPEATFLASSLEQPLQETEFHQFLDRLWLELNLCLSSIQAELAPNQRRALTFALNKNPMTKDQFVDVSPQGDLITSSGRIPWQSL